MSQNNGPRGISVGGPGGIRIDGADIEIGGTPIAGEGMPMHVSTSALAGPMPSGPTVWNDPIVAVAPLLRYPGVVAATLSMGACVFLLGTAVVISALQLPWLLFAAPGAISAALLVAATAIVVRARKQVTTGGIDPDVEQRILDLAVACGGKVTVTAVARALSIPLARADATLSALAKAGHVAIENDAASGVVIYVFPDIDAGLVPLRRSP